MEFGVLGPLAVSREQHPIPLHGARQRRLLACLLLHANAIVPFSRLTDELWEQPPATSHQQIYNAMAALRRALRAHDCDVDLTTVDDGYLITVDEAQLDLLRFQAHLTAAAHAERADQPGAAIGHLHAALAEWRGPALPGLDDRTMAGAIIGLQEQRLGAMERLASLRVETGDHSAVVTDLVRWVADHPLREPLRASLMLALHYCGRQADALAAYDDGRRILADELGIDPGAQLRRLHEQILRGMPGRPGAAGPQASFVSQTLVVRDSVSQTVATGDSLSQTVVRRETVATRDSVATRDIVATRDTVSQAVEAAGDSVAQSGPAVNGPGPGAGGWAGALLVAARHDRIRRPGR